MFAEALHVGRPNIGNRQKFEARVADILDRRWLTNSGQYVKELEQRDETWRAKKAMLENDLGAAWKSVAFFEAKLDRTVLANRINDIWHKDISCEEIADALIAYLTE